MHWNDTNQLPFRLFWWESPDGSKVLTYFPTDYVHDNVSPTRITNDFAQTAERNPGTTEMMDLYGIGDHGGGPTRSMLDQADHWIAEGKAGEAVPTMRYHTAQQYFTSVEGKLNPDSPVWNYDRIAKGYTVPPAGAGGTVGVPTWKDELYFEYHRGVFTTQAAHKRNMRESETKTLDAEKLASLAWLDGKQYPADPLMENWKKITFNQFHDLAAGSGIGVIYKDAQRDYDEVFQVDREVSSAALDTLAARVDTQGKAGVPVLVFNSKSWPVTGTVRLQVQMPDAVPAVAVLDPEGAVVESQVVSNDQATHSFELLARVEKVPALGYLVLRVVPKPVASAMPSLTPLEASVQDAGNAFSLSNGVLKLIIDKKTGCVTEFGGFSKSYLAAGACGNQLQTYHDLPKQYDAWNIDPGTLDGPMTPIDEVDSIAISQTGPVRAAVKITRHWGSSKFIQEISLDAGADSVEVANDFDWHETHVLLKAAWPLKATSAKATYEIPYGSIERTTLRTNSWEKAKFEVPAQRWADLGDAEQGVSLLNDSKFGYDAAGNLLRLTLLRSPTWPDPVADRGRQVFRYAVYPHAGSWKDAQTVRRGYELNDPMTAMQVQAHSGELPPAHSFASVENPNVTLTAIKKAEDANALIFRMYEWAGKATEVKLHVPARATGAVETNLLEKVEGGALPMAGDVVTVPIKPFEILTVQVGYKP
jgi:alpha-mannosidase